MMNEFRKQCLQAHNDLRRKHGCPELKLSQELTDSAQKWAEELASRGIPLYDEDTEIGQNIAFLQVPKGSIPRGSKVTHLWYSEHDRFRYSRPRYQKDTSQFTRIVWKSTEAMGVGFCQIDTEDNDVFVVVVNYKPPGNTNMPGDFFENVPPAFNLSDDHILSKAHQEVLI